MTSGRPQKKQRGDSANLSVIQGTDQKSRHAVFNPDAPRNPDAAQNVLILSSDTGGGHRSAAHALESSLTALNPGRVLVNVAKVLEDATLASRKLAELYNYMLRDHQDLMKYYYQAVNLFKPNESEIIHEVALGYGKRLVNGTSPSAIVSVHPMVQHCFAYVLKKLGLRGKVPFYTVVTDPCAGFWRGWACEDVDLYYVASHEAKQQLIDYGIGSHKIKVTGMPVHSRFKPVNSDERRALRENMDLDPDKFTVFLNSGWIGGGNVPQIYETLAASGSGLDSANIQAIFLAGQNGELIARGHEIAQSAPFPVKVVGYSNEIENLMNASDVMVTKMGGLTTFEALACRLPIIADAVTPPMPQEAQTGRFLTTTGAGIMLDRPEAIVSVVESLSSSPEKLARMREAAQRHAGAGAADRIARDLVNRLK